MPTADRVFVNGRGRDVIMQDMRRRIDRGDIEKEKEEIIQVRFIVIDGPGLAFACVDRLH